MSSVNLKSDYLTNHLITYLGNKRRLLNFINNTIDEIKKSLGKDKLSMFDGFSGSGSVARLFKHYSSKLYANDLEGYSQTINLCYLSNKSQVKYDEVVKAIDYLNASKLNSMDIGFIERNYAPVNDDCIKHGERVFYTNKNSKIIDNVRRLIRDKIDQSLMPFVLAPLLVKASIHNNTSGVFKGFHKKDDIGHFGGAGENALFRIKGEITLDYPIFCEEECPTEVIRGDINKVVSSISDLDVAYYDPPYNQHPYGSNYFMLNIINDYNNPEIQEEGVSGIAKEWNKSLYNKRQEAEKAMDDLIGKTNAKYVLVSYNNEGIIHIDKFRSILEKYGTVEKVEKQSYTTYRGSHNFGKDKLKKDGEKRALKVDELLWVLKK
jgi:adenine-specific DNA-methyltransferase